MTIKLEVGKRYELNNGEVHECTGFNGDDPLSVSFLGFGPFIINSLCYHQDGRFGSQDARCGFSVKRCVEGPKTWGEMTDAEKGAVLLALHEGKGIEFYSKSRDVWMTVEYDRPIWGNFDDDICYRVKPDPVVEDVELLAHKAKRSGNWTAGHPDNEAWIDKTHRITFDTIDGEPDCDSVKMEKL